MNPAKTQPTACSTNRATADTEAPTVRGRSRARGNTGRGFESSGLQASNRRWRFPCIESNNFGFFDPMVFNGTGHFRWRKGRVSATVRLIAGHGTRFTVAQLEARELAAPVKKYPGGDSKVQCLQRATGFGPQLYR